MRIKVYQVENELDSKGVKFCSYDSALKLASVIDPSIYERIFDGNVDASNLEDVFEALNSEHPIGYRGILSRSVMWSKYSKRPMKSMLDAITVTVSVLRSSRISIHQRSSP